MDKKNTNTKMAFFYHNKNKQKLLKSNQTRLKISTDESKIYDCHQSEIVINQEKTLGIYYAH